MSRHPAHSAEVRAKAAATMAKKAAADAAAARAEADREKLWESYTADLKRRRAAAKAKGKLGLKFDQECDDDIDSVEELAEQLSRWGRNRANRQTRAQTAEARSKALARRAHPIDKILAPLRTLPKNAGIKAAFLAGAKMADDGETFDMKYEPFCDPLQLGEITLTFDDDSLLYAALRQGYEQARARL
jgi:hypothetical protein